MNLFPFLPGYTSAIFETGRQPAFVMMFSFLLTYIIARGYTRLARKTGWGSASFGGVHTHHMVFGLVIAFLAGGLMFSFLPGPGPFLLILAAAFGCGASLVLDEFALIFHLEDVYWEQEGRSSIDAVVLAAAFGCLFLMRITPFGTGAGRTGWVLALSISFNLGFAIIAGLKGKIRMAVFGVFVPLVAMIGAFRLAKPQSIWAHKFYRPNSRKTHRSTKRYEHYANTWRQRKEKAWDIIGGKTGR